MSRYRACPKILFFSFDLRKKPYILSFLVLNLTAKDVMNAYAVVETGGKQYLVRPEDTVTVELLPDKAGTETILTKVLAVSDGTNLKVGKPRLENASVNALVLKHIRGPKVVAYKQKRRKGYSRKKGHRQELTVLKIKEIKG